MVCYEVHEVVLNNRNMRIKKMEYETDDLVKVAARDNNSKRSYLYVNPLQAKHIPANPCDTIRMINALAEKLENMYGYERIFVIGFAETATAIAAGVAVRLKNSVYYQTTTRETQNLENEQFLYFTESHSHATEQKLVISEYHGKLKDIDRIVFVEDEVTTGNTIMKLVRQLRTMTEKYEIKFSIASILNSMSNERLRQLESDNIKCIYLNRIPFEYKIDDVRKMVADNDRMTDIRSVYEKNMAAKLTDRKLESNKPNVNQSFETLSGSRNGYEKRKYWEEKCDSGENRNEGYDSGKNRNEGYDSGKNREEGYDSGKNREEGYDSGENRNEGYDSEENRNEEYENEKYKNEEYRNEITEIDMGIDFRIITSVEEYRGKLDEFVEKFAEKNLQISENKVSNDDLNNNKNVLIIGTEEFMFPAIMLGNYMIENHLAQNVKTHSTTRSPILVSGKKDYPLQIRYEIASFYESDRRTFIYNLDKYDQVWIVTDAINTHDTKDFMAGLDSLTAALRMNGNDNIGVVVWKI